MIHHLAQTGDAKLIASPELFVREGEEATFHSGGEFPVSTSSENYGRFHRHVEWKPFGVHLKVRPQSFDGLHISSEINVEISELNAGLAVDG
ncbi:MAG: type II/III secretion system protein, partial [Verrucomicrobiales bacterium]